MDVMKTGLVLSGGGEKSSSEQASEGLQVTPGPWEPVTAGLVTTGSTGDELRTSPSVPRYAAPHPSVAWRGHDLSVMRLIRRDILSLSRVRRGSLRSRG